MIKITDKVKRNQKNFWNNCLFHPTDAVEDSWGKRILDRISEDKTADTIRIYAMLEDIVLKDEKGKLTYDFRVNDLRLDYLHEKGFNVLIAYGMMPACLAKNPKEISEKIRYKGKDMITSVPASYEEWEEVCYEYSKHLVERYGIETVSKWRMQCFNEPDWYRFFMSDTPRENNEVRLEEYKKMYAAFARGVKRADERIWVGGPALSFDLDFFEKLMVYVKENNIPQDFISIHIYGTLPRLMNDGTKPISVENSMAIQKNYSDIIERVGLSHIPLIIDEWGASGEGFTDIKTAPSLIFRETEVFASYYIKMIAKYLEAGYKIDKMLICLSGQHEMKEDFTGFRNFFTLNFIAKPIYNAYLLASKLKEELLLFESDKDNLYVIPTKDNDKYAVMINYSSDTFEENIPSRKETLSFEADIVGKKIKIYCIDKNHTNPYRMYEKIKDSMTDSDIVKLREEGTLAPVFTGVAEANEITLDLIPNSTYLVEVE